jgi:F-type H+-transporting ATPase subunit b
MEFLKLLNTSELVAQIISFLILFFVLKKFFWEKILAGLDQRKERIASELKKISDEQAAVAKLKREFEEQLASIDDLAKERIQQAIAQGQLLTDELRKKAHEEASQIIEHAKENIRYELVKAKQDLKEEIVELSIKAAENIIQEKFTPEQDKNLVRDFLKKIDEAQ